MSVSEHDMARVSRSEDKLEGVGFHLYYIVPKN